jgi:two-component system response regulator FixJ
MHLAAVPGIRIIRQQVKKERSLRSNSTILIVDDDPAVRNALKFSLEVEGFPVRAYADARALLTDADMPGDGCLVVDYRLPGMSGLELLDELRHRKIDLPAILITTHPSSVVRQRAAAAGVPVIEKPLLTEALFQGIRDALARKSSAPAAARPTSH